MSFTGQKYIPYSRGFLDALIFEKCLFSSHTYLKFPLILRHLYGEGKFSKQRLFKALPVLGRPYFRSMLIFEKVLFIARVRYLILNASVLIVLCTFLYTASMEYVVLALDYPILALMGAH